MLKSHHLKSNHYFPRLSNGLSRTRQNFTENLSQVVLGKKSVDEGLLEEIETLLLLSDVGVETTQQFIDGLSCKLSHKQLKDENAVWNALREDMFNLLTSVEAPLHVDAKPYVILMVGVNGTGKTTTMGKMAKRLQNEGKSVMFAAGDTFRAAAIEQLQEWGQRNQVSVVAQHTGADSASVIFDALESATAKKIDVLIADTAGRLHTQHNLMEELKKIKKVIGKFSPEAPHEIMLVLDASIGQNALSQAKQFNEAIGISSITLTKLDGTAKGGIIFAIANCLKIPIRFVGVGEKIDDLQPFCAEDFIEALFNIKQ